MPSLSSSFLLLSLALLLLSLISSSSSSSPSSSTCSRPRSRMAKRALAILEEELDALGLGPSSSPSSSSSSAQPFLPQCPWGPEAVDMFARQELHKEMDGPQRAVCGFCGKSFRSEGFLDLHFATKHPETVNTSLPCLASFCDELSCDLHADSAEDIAAYLRLPCIDSVMLSARKRCEVIVDRCFSDDDDVTTTVEEEGSSSSSSSTGSSSDDEAAQKKMMNRRKTRRSAAKEHLCEALSCERLRELRAEYEPTTVWDALWIMFSATGTFLVVLFYMQLALENSNKQREQDEGRTHHHHQGAAEARWRGRRLANEEKEEEEERENRRRRWGGGGGGGSMTLRRGGGGGAYGAEYE